jgi:YaiO family outer membrane protein
MRSAGRTTPESARRALCLLRSVLVVALAVGGPAVLAAATEMPPLVRSVEAGGAWGHYTEGYGDANGQFVRGALWRPDRWAWRVEVGRSERFGDRSLDGGASYARWFGRTSATLGASSGTGEFIAHRYRLDASVSRPLAGVVTTLGYTRIQSKGDNRSDGLGLSLVRYTPHWVLNAQGRYDLGQPGNTRSTSGGVGISYVVWRRTSFGVGYDVGDVSYQLVAAGNALVDYHSTGFNAGFSQWFDGHWGLNLRAEYGDTPFYTVRGATLSIFREW